MQHADAPRAASPATEEASVTGVGRRVPRWLKWVAPAVLVVQAVLVLTGALDLGSAVIIALALGALMALAAVVLAATAGSLYRRLRRQGASRQQAFIAALEPLAPAPMLALLRHELGIFTAYLDAARGRRDVPPDAVALPYGREQRPMVALLLGLSLIEVVISAWLIPWPWLEVTLLVLGVYGIVWILGFQLAMCTRPHVVTGGQADARLLLRFAHTHDVSVPLSAVTGVRKRLRSGHEKTVAIEGEDLAVSVMGTTTMTLDLHPGSEVVVNGRDRHAVSTEVLSVAA